MMHKRILQKKQKPKQRGGSHKSSAQRELLSLAASEVAKVYRGMKTKGAARRG